MARVAKTTKTTKPASGRRPGRRAGAVAKMAAKAGRPAAAPKRAAAGPTSAPQLSKDELRAQVTKLERANAALRAKSREAGKAAKTAAARIAELEDQVARFEKQSAARAAGAERGPAGSSKGRRRPQRREIDPGGAVPPGVAVEEPAPLDQEAATARENLDEHLGGE